VSDQRGDSLLRQLGHRAAEFESEHSESGHSEGGEDSNEWLREAGRPLDVAARKRIVARLEKVVAGEVANREAPAIEAPRAKEEAMEALPRAFPRRPFPAWVAWPLAAAALIAFVSVAYRGVLPWGPGAAVVEGDLPSYSLRVEGGTRSLRSSEAPEGPLLLAPGNRLQLILTPQEAVPFPIQARAFLSDGEGWRKLGPGLLEVSAQGAVRLEAVIGENLSLPPGPGRLLLVTGTEEALAASLPALLAGSEVFSGPRWRAFLLSFEPQEEP